MTVQEIPAFNSGILFAQSPLNKTYQHHGATANTLRVVSSERKGIFQTRAFARQKLAGTRSPSVRSLQYRTLISVGPKICTSANPIRLKSHLRDAGSK